MQQLTFTQDELEAIGAALDAWANECDPANIEGLLNAQASAWQKLRALSPEGGAQ